MKLAQQLGLLRSEGSAITSGGTPVNFTTAFSRQIDAPPILTRNSLQSTRGVDTKGLQISTTDLGDYRQGRAISQGQIFPSVPYYPTPAGQVFFQNIGNNTYQPEDNSAATHALISRLGDNKFKAYENAPFADYMAEQRLAREVQDSERTAGLQELGLSREILRNLVATRREQNESDYLRRALDSGMSAQDAQDELEGLRRNHALAEMKAEDRSYQAKLLITRIAKSRGIASSVQEPLDRASAIHNPQPSEQMANAMGMVGEGFGQGQLDVARQFLTPEFYRRMLRRSNLTSEAADRQTAMNQAFAEQSYDNAGTLQNSKLDSLRSQLEQEEDPEKKQILLEEISRVAAQVTQTGQSFATLQGQEREQELERGKQLIASRLEVLRNRGKKLTGPLPHFAFAPELLRHFFSSKKAGEPVRYHDVVIHDMTVPELMLAVNQVAIRMPAELKAELLTKGFHWENKEEFAREVVDSLEKLTGRHKMDIPLTTFPATSPELSQANILRALRNFANSSDAEVKAYEKAGDQYASLLAEGRSVPEAIEAFAQSRAREFGPARAVGANPLFTGAPAGIVHLEPLESSGGGGAGQVPVFHPGDQLAVPGVAGVNVNVRHEQTDFDAGVAPLAGAGHAPRSRSGSPPRAPAVAKQLSGMKLDELKQEAGRLGLAQTGTRKDLQDRIREHKKRK